MKDKCDCDEIVFLQAITIVGMGRDKGEKFPDESESHLKEFMSENGWSIDKSPGATIPWYGLDASGEPITVGKTQMTKKGGTDPVENPWMIDTPTKSTSGREYFFETCALCISGKDANKIYGCIHWSFIVQLDFTIESKLGDDLEHKDNPTENFKEAAEKWNEKEGVQQIPMDIFQ